MNTTEETKYFSHDVWDSESILKQSAMQKGRLIKSLDKEYNFDGQIMTLKQKLESIEDIEKKQSDNMHKWSRRKYNAMRGEEQKEYESKLLKGRTHFAGNSDGDYEIPKIVFDALGVKDTTDYAKLGIA